MKSPLWLAAVCVMPTAALANQKPVNDAIADMTFVVTPRYWKETVKNYPGSLEVLDGDTLNGQISNLDQHMSNVRVEQSSVQTRVVIRGSTGLDTGLQNPTAWTLDGVALPMGGSQLPRLFNLSHIELLKGPQGDLYGRNSEAGVIKLQSRDTDWTPSFAVGLSNGVSDGADGNAPAHTFSARASDALITEKLAGQIALRIEDNQGPHLNLLDNDNEGGASKNSTVVIGLDAIAGSSTDLSLRSHIAKDDAGKSRIRYATGLGATERFTTNYNTDTHDNRNSAVHALTVSHQFGDLNLVSVTGLTRFERDFNADLDVSPGLVPPTLFHHEDDMISQELRLESIGAIDWIAGLYLYDQSDDLNFTIGGTQTLPRTTRDTAIEQSGIAAFGQMQFSLVNTWNLTLGTRVERVSKEGKQVFRSLTNSEYDAEIEKDVVLPKATLSFQASDDSLFYASLAKGYLPGGFNYSSAQNIASFTYNEETSLSTELGYKFNNAAQGLNLEATIFHIETNDKQIVDLQPGFVQSVSNAAKTTSVGLELNASYDISDALSVYGHSGWMRAKADEYTTHVFANNAFIPLDLSGNRLPLAPAFSWGLGARFQAQNGYFAQWRVSGTGDYFFDAANSIKQEGYTRIDGELGYTLDDYTITLFAENLSDEEIFSRAVNTPNGVAVEDTSPRFVGLRITGEW